MQKIRTIINKELKAHLDNFSGYLMIFIFLALAYYFFFQTFFVTSEVTVQYLFSDLSWLLCVFVAAITMNAFAAEREKMTIEYLLTKPITIWQLLWGKIFGNFIFALIPILLTLPIPLFVSTLGPLDFGEVLAGYLAAVLLTFALVCIGTALSALVKKPIMAFILTAVVLLFLNIISSSFFAVNLSSGTAAFLARFGLMDHYFNLLRGVIDLTDLAYFILLSGVGIVAGYLTIYSWRFNKLNFPMWQVTCLVLSVILLGYLAFADHSWLQIRGDLTFARRYTLSPLTKDILRNGEPITIEVYISDNLPTQFQNTIQEIKNILNDYSRVAGSNLTIQYLNPKGREAEMSEKGIMAVPFSVISGDNFQQQTGYVGALLKNDQDPDNPRVINFYSVQNIDYELTKTIATLKDHQTVTIGYLTGAGEMAFPLLAQTITNYLGSDVEFAEVRLEAVPFSEEEATDEEYEEIDLNQYAALIITQPVLNYTAASQQQIYDYYDQGGKILYISSGNRIEGQLMIAETSSIEPAPTETKGITADPVQLFTQYGLEIDKNLIGDYQAPSLINTGNGAMALAQYEYWPQAQVSAAATNFAQLPPSVTMFWPSSLQLSNPNPNQQWLPLYQTTKYGVATQSADIMSIEPASTKITEPNGQLGQYIMAAVQTNPNQGQLLAIANPQIFADSLLGNGSSQSNVVLGMTILEKLASTRDFSSIQARQIGYPRFLQDDDFAVNRLIIQIGAPLTSLALLGGLAWSRVYRQNRLRKQLDSIA